MALRRRRFAARRRACGYSQDTFAQAVGVDRTTVGRWEIAASEPQPWHRRKIARLLDLSLDELAGLLAGDSVAGDGVTPHTGEQSMSVDDAAEELRERLLSAAAVDAHAMSLLAAQADHIREVDRMLGARAAEPLMRGHLASLDQLRTFSISTRQREPLARLYANAATLAGWQCLDLGSHTKAWQHYEAAKDAAREEGSPVALAHAMAEQAYVLVDVGEQDGAVQLVEYSCAVAGTLAPPLMLAWLSAVRGEVSAAAGNEPGCRRAFDAAERLLPADPRDPELPYIFLGEPHLARWRGNARAVLGDGAAIEDLRIGRCGLDSTFTRARAGLHADLAHALVAAGQHDDARTELRTASGLAAQVGSVRQGRRIRQLKSVLQAA